MFEEDYDQIYESGPEEADIIAADRQLGEMDVRTFRVTPIFF